MKPVSVVITALFVSVVCHGRDRIGRVELPAEPQDPTPW